MDITFRMEGFAPVLTLDGRLDSYGASLFDEEVAKIGEQVRHIVIDLSRVGYISSLGIRSLMALEKRLRPRKGGILLVGLSPMVAQVIGISGLQGEFWTSDNLSDALRLVEFEVSSQESATRYAESGREYILRATPGGGSVLDLWGSFKNLSNSIQDATNLIPANLEELGFAIGVGGFGASRSQAAEALGEFIAAGSLAGAALADGHSISDFILSQKPSNSVVYLAAALGLSGQPFSILEVKSEKAFPISDLLKDVYHICAEAGKEKPPLIGLVILADVPKLKGSFFKTLGDIGHPGTTTGTQEEASSGLIIGVAADEAGLRSSADSATSGFAEEITPYRGESPLCLHAHGVTFSSPSDAARFDPRDAMSPLTNLDDLRTVVHVELETLIKNAKVWIYLPNAVRPGEEKRIRVEGPTELEFPEELEMIVRRIYRDASRVVLTPLHGGFMSKTFYVASYDRDGRRLLPTVLKTGSLALTQREADAYRDYVEKFILNNSTTIMGTAAFGNWAGLRYNFLGVSGPDSQLTWLEKIYVTRPVTELLPLLDTIYTGILKPWYGQPKFEMFQPYLDHSPFRLFPHILEDAEKELDISPDEPMLACPELGRELPNPYRFLKYEYPKRATQMRPWYKSVIHGDLSMKNVLLDEAENIYIIDFSETRVSNVVSDFARLEPIVKFELTRLENETDLKRLVEFEAGLAEVSFLGERPKFIYGGGDGMVEKAYQVICRMRKYADIVTLFETDLVPYLLALLEWTYPVVSYWSVPVLRKRLAAYSAALICERILDLEK